MLWQQCRLYSVISALQSRDCTLVQCTHCTALYSAAMINIVCSGARCWPSRPIQSTSYSHSVSHTVIQSNIPGLAGRGVQSAAAWASGGTTCGWMDNVHWTCIAANQESPRGNVGAFAEMLEPSRKCWSPGLGSKFRARPNTATLSLFSATYRKV